ARPPRSSTCDRSDDRKARTSAPGRPSASSPPAAAARRVAAGLKAGRDGGDECDGSPSASWITIAGQTSRLLSRKKGATPKKSSPPDFSRSNIIGKPASPMLKVGAGAPAKTQRDKARKTGPSDDGQYWPEVHHGGSGGVYSRPELTAVPILASAKAVDPAMTDDFGLEVEHRSTPRNYTARRTPPFET
ncbi:hypothetical protein THAOC_19576, partial [Thalassiosira oceanica]